MGEDRMVVIGVLGGWFGLVWIGLVRPSTSGGWAALGLMGLLLGWSVTAQKSRRERRNPGKSGWRMTTPVKDNSNATHTPPDLELQMT